MTTERLASSGNGSPSLARAVEAMAALSGLFLVLTYVSGRIYLQTYYSVFHTELSELDFSVQDIMFESMWSLLGPALSAVGLLAFQPFSRQIENVRHEIDAFGLALADIKNRVERNANRADALPGRVAAGELSTSQLQDEMAAIDVETAELDQALISIGESQHSIDSRMPTLPGPLSAVARAANHISTPIYLVAILGLMWTATYVEVYFLAGRESANWSLAGTGILVPPSLFMGWFAWQRRSQAPHTSTEFFGALAYVCYVVLLVPFVTGLAFAHASTAANNPGSGLATVVLTAERPLDPTWTATGGDYVSPKLRLLGKNSQFLVVWNPATPSKSYSITLSTIREIERSRN